MVYSAEISRTNPTAILILLDQSSSMSDSFGGSTSGTKSIEAARIVNRFLTELTIKCAKSEGIRDYYEVGVLGYSRGVSNALGGSLASNYMNPISEIGQKPLRLESLSRKISDGAGGLVEVSEEFPVWVEPQANGSTPTCQALTNAAELIGQWIALHSSSYPPTVLNVTDGETNDGDPVLFAQRLRDQSTDDGHVLLFNCHISSSAEPTISYPATDEGLSDQFAKQLFVMSSELPLVQLEAAQGEGFRVVPGSKGFVFNAGIEDLIRFIEIGTRSSTLR